MQDSQKRALDRKKFFADPFLVAAIAGIFLFLLLFILYPLSILLVDSVYIEQKLSLSVFVRIFQMTPLNGQFLILFFLGHYPAFLQL